MEQVYYDQIDKISVNSELTNFLKSKNNWKYINLLKLNPNDTQHELPFEITTDSVYTKRWIGALQFRDAKGTTHDIIIKPRIGQDVLRYLFGGILNLTVLSTQSPFSQTKEEDIIKDILALAWYSCFKEGYRIHGFTKEYISKRDPHSEYFQGRLDVDTHIIENIVHQNRIAIDYFELTYNHHLNQIILEVINHLQKYKVWPFRQTAKENSYLMHIKEKLLTLGLQNENSEKVFNNKIQWRRHNRGYRPSWNIARAILGKKCGLKYYGNQQISYSYFFDMAEIWEMFLYKRLRKVISNNNYKGLVIESPRLERPNIDYLMRKDEYNYRGLIPDFILKDTKGNPICIIDAKYKYLKNEWHLVLPKNDDITQMALYQSHYIFKNDNVKALPGVLLYPRRRFGNEFNNIDLQKGNYDEGTLNITKFRPKLSWWLIDVDCQYEDNHHKYVTIEMLEKNVDNTLRNIIEWVLDANNIMIKAG